MRLCRTISFFSLLVLFSSLWVSQAFAETSEVEARVVLDNVGTVLEKAYVAVANAETAGANVSLLKGKLAHAGQLLDAANASFNEREFDDSALFALSANESLDGVDKEASELMIAARENRSQRFYFAILESSIGVSLAIFVVLIGWVYFKRYYARRVLGLKPEVSQSES